MKRTSTAIAAILLLGALSSARGQYVVDSLDVRGRYATSMTYSRNWGAVYGTCASGIFYCIWISSNTVLPWALRTPRDVAYDSIDDQCYITYSTGGDDSIRVAQGTNGGEIRSFALPWADKCLWDAQVNRLYVTRGWLNSVVVIDCATDSVIADIAVGSSPFHMAMNPTRRKLYVGNWDGESISVIDLDALRLIRTIPLGQVPQAAAYSAVGDKCYFQGWGGLRVIDCSGDSVVASIPLPAGAAVEAILSVEAHGVVLVGCSFLGSDTVYVVDAVGDTLRGRTPVGAQPVSLSYSSATDLVYCACRVHSYLYVLSGDGSRVVRAFPVGSAPTVVLAVPDHRSVYVGHSGSHYVYVVRDTAAGLAEAPPPLPYSYLPLQAWPNPFSARVSVKCIAAQAGVARVFSSDGRLIRCIDAAGTAGESEFIWNGQDDTGRDVQPGVYAIAVGAQRLKVLKVR